MRKLKELLCEGERIYELTRCASSSVYFIGPETDDIDRMDILGFLKVRAWKAKQAKEKEAPRQRYIDEVWPRVVP